MVYVVGTRVGVGVGVCGGCTCVCGRYTCMWWVHVCVWCTVHGHVCAPMCLLAWSPEKDAEYPAPLLSSLFFVTGSLNEPGACHLGARLLASGSQETSVSASTPQHWSYGPSCPSSPDTPVFMRC